MLMNLILGCFILSSLILMIFFMISKNFNFDILSSSTFECGFTSYFFSHFSFSMHYFLIGLIFLFLDLELCYLFPFLNGDFSSLFLSTYFWLFILVLVAGLMEEWGEGLLDWKF